MTTEVLAARAPRPVWKAIRWVRGNLFSSAWNSLLTVVVGVATAWLLARLVRWVLATADWEVILVNSKLYMVGRYPGSEVWRVWVALGVVGILTGVSWGYLTGGLRLPDSGRGWTRWGAATGGVAGALLYAAGWDTRAMILLTAAITLGGRQAGAGLRDRVARRTFNRVAVAAWLASYVFILWFLSGWGPVDARLWGGYMLTILLTVNGIALAFPLGVLMALGRASSFPAIRLLSVGYIELIRGVPLVTVLMMAFLLFPFLVPPGVSVPILFRALGGIILFQAAYVAENVRGGLQSIPRGQYEAAYALGLSPMRVTWLIVLPQALRVSIPALVGQFISLFKDTSLVIVVGLIELTTVATAVTQQAAFRNDQAEALAFAALLYWVVAFSMSRWSQVLERKLGLGER